MSAPRKHPEKTFDAWVDRLIDRIVIPPMFQSLIGHEHTDMASIGRRMALIGRGLAAGLPDRFVAQYPIANVGRFSVWLEAKRGTRLSERQRITHSQMLRAGQNVITVNNMAEVVAALRSCGFVLHPNADALAAEYEQRVIASETAPAKPRTPGRPRAKKATAGQVARARRSGFMV
jgi:hypothetical protein